MSNWQLPEGIDELTGQQAAAFEIARRSLIDAYMQAGYELVIPPIVENVDSMLLASTEVDQKTFKFLDPLSTKMLGVHADITPQIARIDAKHGSDAVKKYCYVNAILQTKADDFYQSRSPIQAGAELYGADTLESDVEVIKLMLESMSLLGISPVVLSLGNVAIFNTLIAKESLTEEQAQTLREIFVKRSNPDLQNFIGQHQLNNEALFSTLMTLEGEANVLDTALEVFAGFDDIKEAVARVKAIGQALDNTGVEIIYDLAETKAYGYHTGVIFSAYHQDYSKALAQGGRYNNIGQAFGQSRAATGFSFDLKFLSNNH